ncbi:retrovirus-related pol polyprotein from transposon TNT 1-94 [Tanacetum coccineum]
MELVKEHLASVEVEKMVEGLENVIDDSLLPRNDESKIPCTRLEPMSDMESPEVEITNDKEVEITNDEEVEITNVVIPVNVNEEEEEITDEVYELKRREKGKIVEESRSTPFPTPIRSPRIHTDLSFDTLVDHLQEVMVESLPTMVDTHIKEKVKKQVPEQAKISSQIQKAIDNHIPSQVDVSVRSYMFGHILHVHPVQSQTPSVPEQQYQLYLSMKNDPQLQQQNIAIWLALQMKFESLQVPQTTCRTSAVRPRDQDGPHDDAHPEGENRAKWQKTSGYEAYVSGESSSGQVNENEQDDDEIPTKQISQDIMEEISLTIDEAKLKKMVDELFRQRCTSGDEHQYHIDQMKNFLKSDIRDPEAPPLSLINQDLLYLKKRSSGPEKIVVSLHKFPAIIFNDDDIGERTSRWVNKKQKEPGKPKEVIYLNSKIIQVIKTYWELGHAHKFITKIVARRANECIVSITEPDYKNLNKNDIEDMYLLIMNGKVPDYAETGLLWVLEGLRSYNNDVKYGYIQRDLTNEEVEYLKLFEEEIEMTTSVVNNSVFRGFFEKQILTRPNFIDWYRKLQVVLSVDDKLNYLEHTIPAALVPAQAGQQVPLEALAAYAAWEEGKSVSSYVLQMKSYIDNLERLGHHVSLNLAVSLILASLNKEYDSFVENYNMHDMGKTVNELHVMLKLHEQTLPKKNVAPALHAIRAGKMARKPCSHQVERAKDLLGLIHTNVCGPFRTVSRQGASYFVTFTDDFSRYGHVYLLKHKHEVFETFKVFQKEVENQLGKTIKSLHFDRGGEYMSQEFLDHLKERRIIAHRTPPYKSQHNGVSERRNRTLLDMVHSMMSQTTLPKSFWDYAFASAARILNMVPTKKVENTPYEVWHGQAPKMSYLKVWGCKAIVKHDTLTKPDKLEPRSIKCIFIGYPKETIGYSFYYPPENKVLVARNAEFFENSLITQEVSGSLEDLKIIQEVDTHPSGNTSLRHDEDDQEIDEPQNDNNPIHRSTRTRHALDRMCLYIDAEEHELGDLNKPANYKAALLDPEFDKWIDAMNVEMQSMKDNQVWNLVDLPPNGKTVGSKWLFKKKTDMDEVVHTYKARLIAKGFTQTYRVDYEETFSPVSNIRAIRILIAITAFYDYEIWQMDVKTAFLNGHLSEEVYMVQHEGASTPAEVKRMQNVSYASAVGFIIRFQQNPGDLHYTAVKNIIKYLCNTKDMFFVYGGDIKQELGVSCYTDAGYLTDVDDLKSQTRYVFILNRGVVDWKSTKQNIFATSSAEAEYIAASDTSKEAANESGITKGARHYRAKVHYLREVIEFGDVKLEKVHTDDKLADPFTKALPFPKHLEHTKNI